MFDLLEFDHNDGGGWSICGPRIIVDVGRISLMTGPSTTELRTLDGYPMSVSWSDIHGWLVAVQTA